MTNLNEAFTKILNKMIEWIDKIFGFFQFFMAGRSNWILIIVGIFVASKIFKVKLNLGGGK